MSKYMTLFVEGTDDATALNLMFPIFHGEIKPANNKSNVSKMVRQTDNSCGLVDRDFEFPQAEEPRIIVLERYALENYLLEPAYLYELAKEIKIDHHATWSSEDEIRQLIVKLGQTFCHYATANKLLYEYGFRVNAESIRQYFKDDPSKMTPDEVLQRIVDRFDTLPKEAEIRTSWEERYREAQQACVVLDGIHQWIDGKILLYQGVYPEIRKVYTKNLKKKYVFESLAGIASKQPPEFLTRSLQNIGLID